MSWSTPPFVPGLKLFASRTLKRWRWLFPWSLSQWEVYLFLIDAPSHCSGIGEYIQPPDSTSSETLFTIGPNAVILNQANPKAISEAVVFLFKNQTLRVRISEAGYQTVLSKFSVSAQMKLYERLYSSITRSSTRIN
jgi:glycosyltransferase involved in cell wall biosynthesis